MVYSDVEYANMLKEQSVAELKNIVTTIVKNVRFSLSGKRKDEIISHLVKHTQFSDADGVTLRGDFRVRKDDLLRETSITASGMKRKARSDIGAVKPNSAKAMKLLAGPGVKIPRSIKAKMKKANTSADALSKMLEEIKAKQK